MNLTKCETEDESFLLDTKPLEFTCYCNLLPLQGGLLSGGSGCRVHSERDCESMMRGANGRQESLFTVAKPDDDVPA